MKGHDVASVHGVLCIESQKARLVRVRANDQGDQNSQPYGLSVISGGCHGSKIHVAGMA